MDPINYSIDVATPFQSALAGYQGGAAIRNDQQQQVLLQQQQAAQVQQRQVMQSLLSNPNPTAQDFSNATMLVPGMKDQFKQAWDMRNSAQQQSDLSHSGQVYAALQSGQPEVAAQILSDRAAALRNSGNNSDAQHADVMAGVVREHPELARTMVGMQLASIPGGDKIVDQARQLGNDPATSKKLTADADKARTEADTSAATAPQAIVAAGLANDKTLQDIAASKLTGQISELNTQIGQANSETERGKLVLERDKLVLQQKQQQQQQGQAAQEGMDGSTQALQTLDLIKKHPGMQDNLLQSVWGVPGSKPGDSWGSLYGKMPGTDRQALNGWVDSLKGQLGYQSLMAAKASSGTGASGFGALSEGELKLLSGLAANLDPNSKDFPKQLSVVERYLQKTQSTAAANGKLPTSGGAFVVSSPKYGDIKEGDINRLMVAHPGTTREQVLQFLQQQQQPGQ